MILLIQYPFLREQLQRLLKRGCVTTTRVKRTRRKMMKLADGESEDDLELPRHERKSAQRLLADAPKFGDGILRSVCKLR